MLLKLWPTDCCNSANLVVRVSGILVEKLFKNLRKGHQVLAKIESRCFLTSFSVKKFREFYGSWRFINVLTTAPHLPLAWTRSTKHKATHHISFKYVLISFHLWTFKADSFLPVSKFLYAFVFSPKSTVYHVQISMLLSIKLNLTQ